MSATVGRSASAQPAWDRFRRPAVVVAATLAVLVLGTAVAARAVGEGAGTLLTAVLVLLLLTLGVVLLVTGVVWSRAGRSPTPGALVALGGAVLVPIALLPALSGGSPVGGTLLAAGLAGCWVVAGVVAGQVAPPPTGAVAPRARPAALDRMPWWLLGRVLAVLALLVLLGLGGWWAGQAFTLFPSKETPEDLERIRRAGAVQLGLMVGGTLLLASWWALSFRRRAAAVVLVVAGVVGGLFSIVGFAASLPLVLTAVVLLFLPARPVPAVQALPDVREVDRGHPGAGG